MTQELKPCPFCGGTDVSVCDSTTTRTAKCRSCVVYIAIEKWNSRPIEDALLAEIACLRDIINPEDVLARLLANVARLKEILQRAIDDYRALEDAATALKKTT